MKIENYGVGERCAEAMRLLIECEQADALPTGIGRVVLLPIPTSRDGKHLTGSDVLLSEVTSDVGCGDLVVGYLIPKTDAEYIRSRGAAVCDVADDEQFLEENALITAIGTLGYLLSEYKSIPAQLRIGIVGWGRIGKALGRLLLFFGSKIRVYTSKELTRVALGGVGIESCDINYDHPTLDDLSSLDVLINTAPRSLSSCFSRGVIPDRVCVVELASGNNFEGVEGVIKLPSIPERSYPRSAGHAYFHAIQRFMREVF